MNILEFGRLKSVFSSPGFARAAVALSLIAGIMPVEGLTVGVPEVGLPLADLRNNQVLLAFPNNHIPDLDTGGLRSLLNH